MTTERLKTSKASRKSEKSASVSSSCEQSEVPGTETRPTFSFDDYDNVIGFVVSQASYRLAQALDEVIANIGSDIRPREFPILNRLHQHGALNQFQLAELTYKDRPAITRMLDRLIARKLVTKVPDPMDRRAFVVSLTPRGTALRNNIVPLMVARLQSACGGIPQKNLEITVATLRQISSQI